MTAAVETPEQVARRALDARLRALAVGLADVATLLASHDAQAARIAVLEAQVEHRGEVGRIAPASPSGGARFAALQATIVTAALAAPQGQGAECDWLDCTNVRHLDSGFCAVHVGEAAAPQEVKPAEPAALEWRRGVDDDIAWVFLPDGRELTATAIAPGTLLDVSVYGPTLPAAKVEAERIARSAGLLAPPPGGAK